MPGAVQERGILGADPEDLYDPGEGDFTKRLDLAEPGSIHVDHGIDPLPHRGGSTDEPVGAEPLDHLPEVLSITLSFFELGGRVSTPPRRHTKREER